MIPSASKNMHGFTLIELMIVIAIIGTIAAIATPLYRAYIDNARVARAIIEIRSIGSEITLFYDENQRYPNDLTEIGLGKMRDPYGNLYQYVPATLDKNGKPQVGKMRKDHNLVPVNTDFDLYSMGKDGKSALPFPAKASQDDIVRANDGQYIGLVSGY
jgi:general secretion pathway protein G